MKIQQCALTSVLSLLLLEAVNGSGVFVRDFDTSVLLDEWKDDGFLAVVETPTEHQFKHRAKGKASVSPKIMKSLLEQTGHVLPVASREGTVLPVTVVSKTSPYHRDLFSTMRVDEFGDTYQNYEAVGDEMVAFLAMNTNENAYFDHGGVSVPIVEGSLVVFAGGTKHRTVIQPGGGVVNLLGPFDLLGKRKVSMKGGGGDPHITKWNGERFDYHGECDLVMMKSHGFGGGLGIHLHMRTTIVDTWSYIEKIALQIGSDVLEVAAKGQYLVNGVPGTDLEGNSHNLAGNYIVNYLPPKTEENDSRFYIFQIDLGEGERITIKSFHHKNFMGVSTTGIGFDNFGDALGLNGAYGLGIMVGRDGKTVFANNETDAFGQEWQVRGEEDPQLFHTPREPQYPTTCTMPPPGGAVDGEYQDVPGATAQRRHRGRGRRRRLMQEEGVTREEAELACAHWLQEEIEYCVSDVINTGDLELAEAGSYY